MHHVVPDAVGNLGRDRQLGPTPKVYCTSNVCCIRVHSLHVVYIVVRKSLSGNRVCTALPAHS